VTRFLLQSAVSLALLASLTPAQLTLTLSAPCGAGSARIHVSGATPTLRLFNLISVVPTVPTGSGPLFGLGIHDSIAIVNQLLAPYPSPPTYVAPNPSGTYTWTICLPPGFPLLSVPVDVVSVEWNPVTGFVRRSPVANFTFQF
jgi:hypothetical protein